MTIWTKDFWQATLERILRSVAGALIALVCVAGFSPRTADWADIFITAGLAGFVALLFAITSNGVTKTGPAFTKSEKVVPPEPQPTNDDPEYVPERALNEDEPNG